MDAVGGGRMAEVVLFAEFDIDKGSTLRASFPREIPHYSPEFFADVMLPEGVHNRQEDFTIFFLNRKAATRKYEVAHGSNNAADATQDDGNEASESADSALAEGEDEEKDAVKDPLKEFMYCLSIVHTTYDTSARRGAKVKAVAICSPHKFCFAFKDVLSVAAGKLSVVKEDAEAEMILQELFDVVNAVDTSGVRNLSDMERRLLKRTVSSNGRSVAHGANAKKEMEESLFYRTHAQWHEQHIPLQFKLCSTDDQYDDGLLRKLLLRFGEQTMILYNAVLTGARVIVLGYNQPAGMVYF
ncbi:hypothetical protein FI667_g149, partial [Globisporangium splendens]